MGLNPLRISDGFEKACEIAMKKLDDICDEINIFENNNEKLIEAAMTSLGSKVVS